MPQKCTICTREDYPEIIAMLKADYPRTTVANRFKLDYTSLGRCWAEHRPHDQEYDISEGIRRTQKALDKELKKKLPDQNRLLVKDLETRLKDLRAEQRTLQAIRKEEHPEELASNGETLLTIESLDRLIQKAREYRHATEWDVPVNKIHDLLWTQSHNPRLSAICKEVETLIKNRLAEPAQLPELLPVREMRAN
jgi:hypothetical protein